MHKEQGVTLKVQRLWPLEQGGLMIFLNKTEETSAPAEPSFGLGAGTCWSGDGGKEGAGAWWGASGPVRGAAALL